MKVAGTWIQLDDGVPAGGNWTLRIGVSDLTAERHRLEAFGVTLSETHTIPGVISYFTFSDPDGNQLSCCQEP